MADDGVQADQREQKKQCIQHARSMFSPLCLKNVKHQSLGLVRYEIEFFLMFYLLFYTCIRGV